MKKGNERAKGGGERERERERERRKEKEKILYMNLVDKNKIKFQIEDINN